MRRNRGLRAGGPARRALMAEGALHGDRIYGHDTPCGGAMARHRGRRLQLVCFSVAPCDVQGSLAAQGMPCDTTEDTWDPELLDVRNDGDTGSHTPLSSQLLRSSARSLVSVLHSIPNLTDGATDASGSIAEPSTALGGAGSVRSGPFALCVPPPFGDPRRQPAFRGSRVWGGEAAAGDGASLAAHDRATSAPADIMAVLSLPGHPSGASAARRKSASTLATPRPGGSATSADSPRGGSAGDDWSPSVPLSLTQGIYSPDTSDGSSSLDYEMGDSPSPCGGSFTAAARAHLFEVRPPALCIPCAAPSPHRGTAILLGDPGERCGLTIAACRPRCHGIWRGFPSP